MNKKQAVQPLSENTRKAIIIAAIVAVAIIILSISLALILRPEALSPSDQDSTNRPSSSAAIRNGDFTYVSSDDTSYPKTAQNWTKYSYRKATSSTHGFESIGTNEKVVMGIVDTANDADNNEWATVVSDLEKEGITGIINPGVHDGIEAEDTSVYMMATKGEATTASILSDSVSISSGKSVKISMWLNTAQLKGDSKAVIMIQKSTISALSENWYAYNFEVGQSDASQDNGWVYFEFHIFNRESSTKYIRVSIGIGNVYSGEKGLDLIEKGEGDEKTEEPITGEGILFVDDILYEEVTANTYREVVDHSDPAEHSYKVIENEDITDESQYLELVTSGEDIQYTDADEFVEKEGGFSPFTNRDDFYKANDSEGAEEGTLKESGFTIYKLSYDGEAVDDNTGFRLANPIPVLYSLTEKDHHHISFWIRINQANAVARANIYVQTRESDSDPWTDLSSGNWTKQVTEQEIEEDSNCGWVKYDIYIKPSSIQTEISILFVLGSKEYSENERELGLFPEGDLFVTSPAYEKISYKDYNGASSGTYVKKLDLIGNETTANTSVTNGSFSAINNTGTQPSNWTPAFAGDNTIYKDGKGNDCNDLDKLATTVEGSGVMQNFADAPKLSSGKYLDDKQQNVLRININGETGTSFGYLSGNITLSSRTAYVFSVLAKANNTSKLPYIYLINTDTSIESRSERVIASVVGAQSVDANVERLFGQKVPNSKLADNGWVRYYMVVVTGNQSMTVRLALFNGSLDGETLETGEVYYDDVEMNNLGSYSLIEASDKEKEENPEYETTYKVEWTNHRYVTEKQGFGKNFGELLTITVSDTDNTLLIDSWGIEHIEPTDDDWAEMKKIPEKPDEEEPDDDDKENEEPKEVDLALLFSIISSVALVAALLVVVVIKYFRGKGKGKPKKAA